MTLPYSIVGSSADDKFITVFIPGEPQPLSAHSSHPNFDAIVAKVEADDSDGLADLFDVSRAAAKRFEPLSERVTVANGRLYLDGDEVSNALAKQVVRFLNEGVSDWKPLVAFFENVQANPTDHSREQLFEWLDRHDFSITTDGLIVGYKGVTSDLKSIHSGPGIVNGKPQNGRLDNSIGNVIEMPRSDVDHNPSQGCSRGLHVGTFEFASTFGHGKTVKVLVNPRDVVSVPTDSNWAKVRCCRYKVIDVIDAKVPSAVTADEWDEESDDWYDEEGDW